MTPIATLYPPHLPGYQRGLSLVELMISMVISLILLAGVSALIVQQSQTRDELEKSSRQIENGRYAMQLLHDDIQHAGFFGQIITLPAAPGIPPDPCLTDTPSLLAAMPLAIQGYNNALPIATPFTCALDGVNPANNASNYLAGTDILVIRRADTNFIRFDATPETESALVAGQMYLQTNPALSVMAAGTGAEGTVATFPLAFTFTPSIIYAPLRAYNVHIYFISPCSVPSDGTTSCTGAADDNGRPIPTLKRLDLGANGGVTSFTVTPLAEGIESMQLDYGLDTQPVFPDIRDGYPDSYSAAPAATAWADVMAVRVNLLARNTECTTGYTDSKAYGMGLAVQANDCTNGGYKRHVFSELVRAVNPSGRRAMQ